MIELTSAAGPLKGQSLYFHPDHISVVKPWGEGSQVVTLAPESRHTRTGERHVCCRGRPARNRRDVERR